MKNPAIMDNQQAIDAKEVRFGSWLSSLVACAWLWIGYDSNLKFIL
jgi:hypothetical protein